MKNRKRLLLITLMTAVTVSAFAQQYDPESDFTVAKQDNDKSVAITKYVGSKQIVRIPPTIQGLPVTRIRYSAFSGCTSLTSITIPNSVTRIEDEAFRDCRNLTSIIIPNSVTSIADEAFRDCRSLTSIIIPTGVTRISYRIFTSCTSLTSITIPNGVTSIEREAFNNCTSLTSVTIPNSVTGIGDNAFSYCAKLTTINVATGNSQYTAVDGVLYTKNKSVLLTYPAGKTGAFIIPNSVITIWGQAFQNCTSLESITIPDSVTSIGEDAFYGCKNLTSVTIPSSVTEIMNGAFDGCTSLISVTFQGSISLGKFGLISTFPGDLRVKFYETKNGGTPGTYKTTAPVGRNSVWTKQ